MKRVCALIVAYTKRVILCMAIIAPLSGCQSNVATTAPVDSKVLTISVRANPTEPGDDSHARNLIFAAGSVWGIGLGGTLIRITDHKPSVEKISMPANVFSISRTEDGEPAALVLEELSHNAFVLTRTGTDPNFNDMDQWTVSPPLHLNSSASELNEPLALVITKHRQIILSNRAISSFEPAEKRWKTIPLHPATEVIDASRHVTAISGDRYLWFGNDAGEWNGRLLRIDLHNGDLRDLWSHGPITGIAQRRNHSDCVLVSSGLAHLFMTTGFLLTTCGKSVETLYKGDKPLWGIESADGNQYALVQNGLVPLTATGPDWSHAETFQDVDHEFGGYPAEIIHSMLILYSGARWEVSTSGLTPYAIKLSNDEHLVLKRHAKATGKNK